MLIHSILTVLKPAQSEQIRFIKRGLEIFDYHTTDNDDSPGNKVMAVRGLRLIPGTAIPSHVHHNKEKLYIFGRKGFVVVYIWQGDTVQEFTLRNNGDTVVVPPGRVHALYAPKRTDSTDENKILVVTSSQDTADIEWEPDLEELLKNEHLKS